MPKKAPIMLRMVASKCWASVSWAEKTSSLMVRSRKADEPPYLDHGLMTTNAQHRRVDSKRASTRRVRKLETRLKVSVILGARQEFFFFDFQVFVLIAIRWPCERPVIKGRTRSAKQSSRRLRLGPWQRTFTPREPGSGSQIKNRDGFPLRSQIFLGALTRKSRLPLSTTGARLVHASLFITGVTSDFGYPTRSFVPGNHRRHYCQSYQRRSR
jgi:hypothetical protein